MKDSRGPSPQRFLIVREGTTGRRLYLPGGAHVNSGNHPCGSGSAGCMGERKSSGTTCVGPLLLLAGALFSAGRPDPEKYTVVGKMRRL